MKPTRFLLAAALLVLSASTLSAQSISWGNTGTDYATGANWVGGVAPASSTTTGNATFGLAPGSVVNPNLGAARSAGLLTFAADASAYTIGSSGGFTLNIGANGISNLGTATQTLNLNITMSSAQSWTTASGGLLLVNGSFVDINSTAATNRTLTIAGAGNTTINAVVRNSFAGSGGNLTFGGTGVLTLNGNNTYTGNTTVNNGGTLALGHANALGTGSVNLTAVAGAKIDNVTGAPLALATNNAMQWGANFTFIGSNNLTLGTGAIGMNASRAVTVQASTLTINGEIDINAATTTNRTLTFNGAGNVVANGVIKASFPDNFSGLSYNGTGTLTLSAANSYTGNTNVANGTVLLSGNGTLGASTGGINISGGTLNLGGLSRTRTGNIVLSGGNLTNGTFTKNAGNYDVQSGAASAILAGTAGLIKTTAGTATLSGANTYTGATVLDVGTLIVNGSLSTSSTVTVTDTATLSGSGTIGGFTTIESGGTLSPGNSPGVMTFSNGLTLDSGSITNFEINGLTRGTTYDGINITSGLTTYGGTFNLNFGSSIADGNVLSLFALSGSGSAGAFSAVEATGSYVGSFTNNSGIWSFDNGLQTLSFSQSTGNLSIVPEPSTYAAIFGALALVGVIAHRRRQKRAA